MAGTDEVGGVGVVQKAHVTGSAPASRIMPASVGQASLWFLRKVMPYPSTYNMGVTLRLSGQLDAEVLATAMREIAQRHESCRTTFRAIDGTIHQVIWAELPADVAVVDLSSLADPESEARALSNALGAEPFDLERGPLLRVRVLRFGARDHALVLVMDHIVLDGMSLPIWWRELSALYPAMVAGVPSPLPAPRQFADCQDAQDRWLRSDAFERQLDRATRRLAGAAPCELPTDRPRPPVKSFRGGFVRSRIPPAVVQRLRAFSATERVSVFVSLLTTLDILLARYSQQSDITTLVPFASRERFGGDDVMGYFANVVVLRVEVESSLSARALLKRVGAEIMNGLSTQDVPFEKVISRLRPDRSQSHDPLASVGVSFLPRSGTALELPGVEARFDEVPSGGAKFDLQVFIAETADDLTFCIEYNADIFDRSTIERMVGHYRALLDALLSDPTRAIGELPLLTPDERQRILVDWNATAVPVPSGTTVHALVAASAARSPRASAASFEGETITYEDLLRRCRRVARCLRARGVKSNVLVGLAVERSLDMLVGALAILEAGGAYVPLDPAYPRDRLAAIAEDSGMRVLLTEARLADRVPAAAELLRFDADADEIAAQSSEPLGVEADPESLAYVIFTSGSTGRPKGVPIPHCSVVSFLGAMARQPGMSPSDRLLAVISLSFDMAGFELWLPLMVGAHVEIASREMVTDATALRDRLARSPTVTVLQATPSTFRLLLETGWKGDGAIKLVVGGEALAPELAQQLLVRAGSLWNGYGPTETTIFSTLHRVGDGPVLIGRPIDNTQVYILDRNLQPVPVSVSGEIFIGGVGVARGYLGRPELTRERFLPDPFSGTPDARLYRTGDVARFRPDGTIDYQGRNDFQVKLRGYRIELGEIETTLCHHAAVREAVAAAYREAGGEPKLVAYVTLRAGQGEPDATELPAALRAHLRAKLPEYMVPAHFVVLDRLPLTANNKVDRKALPAPSHASAESNGSAGEGPAPQDELEVKLAAIFRTVLRLPAVSLTDSFFDLGGDSLHSVRLVAEIERVFGKAIPLVVLFRARTVKELAAVLRAQGGGKVETFQLVPIRPVGNKRPLFLMSRPNVNALGYIALARYLDPQQPVYGLQYQHAEEQDLGRPYTYEEYDAWAKSYVETMRLIQPKGPYLLGGMCEGALIAFRTAMALEAAGERVALLAIFDAWPQENTVLRLPHLVHAYHVRWQAFAAMDRRGQVGKVVGIARKLARWLGASRSNGAGSAPPTVDARSARLWPGPGFVPPKVAAKITLFRLERQPYWRVRDRQYGWGNRTTHGVEVHVVPGDEHHNILREPEVATTGRVLAACIERANEPATASGAPERRPDAPSSPSTLSPSSPRIASGA